MGRCWSGGKLARRALTEVDAQRRRCRDRCRARTRPRGRVSPWRVIQLCVVIVQERRSKQFRPPLRGFGELLLLCSCKEEVTKKKARPGANRPAAPAGPLRFSARWGRPTTRFAQTRGPPFSHPACDARFALRVGTAMATATATAARGAWIGLASRRIRARAALDKHCALAAAAVHDRCRDLIGGSYLRERPLRGFAWLGIQGHGERVATGHIRNPAWDSSGEPASRMQGAPARTAAAAQDSRRRCFGPTGAADLKPRRTSYPGCPGQAAHGCAAAASTGMDVRPSGDPDTRGAAAPSGADALPQDRKRHAGRLCSDGVVACPGGYSLAPATCCALRLPARQPPWFQGTPRVCR